MKTDTILLQPFDNIDSILDKLRQVSNAGGAVRRILLVWPKRGKVIEDPVDMARLKIWLKKYDLQAAFVVSNDFVRLLAAEHGFPVFVDRETAQAQNWPVNGSVRDGLDDNLNLRKIAALQSEKNLIGEKKPARPLVYGLVILALLSVLGVFWVLLPHVVIILPSAAAEQTLSIPFWTSDSLSSVTKNGGLPSQSEVIQLDLSVSVPTSGRFRGTGKLASGMVMLSSQCEREQRIAAGTQISSATSATRFETLQAVVLSPGSTAETAVIAVSPGASANLPAGTLTGIESPFDQCVLIRQTGAMTGGDDGYFTAPDQADYDRAAEMILSQVETAVQAAVEERYGSLRMNLPGYAVVEAVSNETLNPGIGFAGEKLNLQQTLRVRVRTVSAQDIGVIAKTMLDAQKESGFIPADEGFSWQVEQPPRSSVDGSIVWTLGVKRKGSFEPDKDALKASLAGEPIHAMTALLEQAGLENIAPVIRRWPGWISRFPIAPANIWIRTGDRE